MKATPTTPRMKTRSILGYKMTLEAGKQYIATLPMFKDYTSKDELPVTIVEAGNPFGEPVAKVDTMPYDKANRFLNAFNNGKMIFYGRVW